MKYRLQDLIDIDHFQNLQDRLNEIYSFPSSIIDNDGKILTATAWQDVCVKFHRKNKESERVCIKSDQYIQDHIHEANPAVTYHCPHGLVDNATPIIIDGIHYGNFFTGQFFLEEPDINFFRAQAKKYGFDEDAYLEAVKKVPVWTKDQLNNYLFFIKGLISIITESALKELREVETRKKLEERENHHHSIIQTAMDGFWLTDTEGKLLEVNDSYCSMSGYREAELLTMRIADLDAAENPEIFNAHMQKVVSQGSGRFESKHRRKDGTVFDVEISVQFRNEDGGRFVVFLRDISDRTETEKSLYEHKLILENISDIAYIADTEENVIYVNPAAQSITGLSVEEIIGRPFLPLFIEKDHQSAMDIYRRTLSGENLENTLTFTSGITCHFSSLPLKDIRGNIVGTFGIARDITAQMQAEKALQESEEMFRALFRQAGGYCMILEPSDTGIPIILDANQAACEAHGYTREEMIGRPVADLDDEEGKKVCIERTKIILSGKPFHVENMHVRKDGSTFPVAVFANLFQFGDKPPLIFTTEFDITERKQAETALRESEKRYRSIFNNKQVVMLVVDPETGAIADANPAAAKFYGYSQIELIQKNIKEINTLPPNEIFNAMQEARKGSGKLFNFYHRLKDGSLRTVEVASAPIEYGDKIHLFSIIQDITDRNQAREALRKSEEQYRGLFNSIRDAIIIADTNRTIIECNPAFTELFGYPANEIIGKKTQYVYENESQFKELGEIINEHYGDSPFLKTVNYKKKNGDVFPGETGVCFLKSSNKETVGFIGLIRDITDRKQIELALKESEERFKSLHNASFGGIAIHDKGIILECNKGMSELTGYAYNELIGMNGLYLISDDTRDHVIANINSGYEKPYEATGVRKDGEKYSLRVEARNIPYKGKEVRVVEFRDITDQKKAETALRESEAKYRLMAENMSDVISIMDMNLQFTYISPSIKRLSGFTVEDHINHSVEEIMPPESFKKVMKVFEEEMMIESSGNADPYRTRIIEFEQYKQDRSTVWVEVSFSFLRDTEQQPVGVLAISRDISDRKQSEVERERLMAAIEQTGDAIVVTDTNGDIQYVNPAFQTVTGYTWQEAINLNPRILKSGHQDKLFYQQLWETILSGRIWSGRMVNKKKDGSLYTEDVTISPVLDAFGQIIHFVAVKRDVTEHLRLSAQLQQAQKMESIGTLAGGIAHDFNNILSSVIGFTELALDDVQKDSPIEDSLKEIYAGGKRARDLVKQILAFARQSDDEIKPIQIDTIAKEVLKLLRASIPATIRVEQSIKKDLTIMGNPTQVHQILMNICTNAAQAMEDDGGVLEISIKDIVIDKGYTLKDLNPGEYIKIKITDTGPGIDPEIMDKIFDPYFTTKDTGKGTGMGLALVHGIVQTYNGMIMAESEPGQGTMFTIYLPLIRERRESDSYQPEILPTGDERILLVDDEMPIVKMSTQILQKLGYDVVFHTSSLRALDLFRSNPDAFDLVITDMTMPDMTGDKLAAELMSIRRDIPVILCTGYSNKISDQIAAAIGIRAFAYKPFSKADLAKTVRKMLDEAKTKTQG